MGEKPVGRTVVVMGLLMVTLLAGFASADTGEVRLVVSVDAAEPWVDVANPLVLTPSLVNDGEAVTLTVNPACPFVLNVYNESGALVVDGEDGCPDRSQGLDMFAGEQLGFDPLTWDMKAADGSWLEGGAYTVEVAHTTTGLTSTHPVVLQTPVTVPDSLAFEVSWQQRNAEDDGVWLGLVSLHNPTSEPVMLNGLASCRLEHRIDGVDTLGAPCFGDVDALMPGEVMLVDHVLVPNTNALNATVSTPGAGFVHVQALESAYSSMSPVEADLVLTLNADEARPYSQGDALVTDLALHGLGQADQSLTFTSSCRAEMWVVDDLGDVVFDSRLGKNCQSIDLEMTLSSSTPLSFGLPQWNFFDDDGCRVHPGVYTVVAELPQYAMAVSRSVEYRDADPNNCLTPHALEGEASPSWLDEQTLQLDTSIATVGQDHYVRMSQPCTYGVNFLTSDDVSVHRFQALCGDYDGRKVLVPAQGDALHFPPFEIAFLQQGVAIVPDGLYTVEVTLLSSSSTATVTFPLAWPSDFTEEDDTPIPAEDNTAPLYELTGTWTGLLTESGTCYVLDMDGTMYLLSNARTLGSWAPSNTVEGIYTVRDTSPSPTCAAFSAPSVEVTEVVMELDLAQETTSSEPVVAEDTFVAETDSSPAVTLVTVVVTTSVLSLLAVVVATNEGLRLPATMAGLWFIGLLGKTHETTDGRYQRCRLMGYLTANPGCHFRALMSALDMSNGQITHHLRILEAEEHVWRKGDGRLVRYYPLTNQLNPATAEEDLPVPPLSPDPNSLQGKILSLLDQDGDLGQFPTQAELAKRLEKSQQLISHHLRTLQKFGLVERRKMGLMNRYKLTREAIFLLETSEDFGQP